VNAHAPVARTALVVLVVLVSGCARIFTRPSRHPSYDARAIIAAGAARERALEGIRLTLSVRATEGPPAARLASPAYLAIDDPTHLHLQVLSPFGVTVFDLQTQGDAFTVTLPLRGETRSGHMDLAALASDAAPDDDRMIVALALLFRPKVAPAHCRAAGAAAISCTIAPDLAATIAVDDDLHVIREDYVGRGGRPVFTAELTEYEDRTRNALPGRIVISDGQGGPALIIRVVKVRRAGDAAPEK
jgi:hypothetical protein